MAHLALSLTGKVRQNNVDTELQRAWIQFLSRFNFNVYFTLTFRFSAPSADCAISRTIRFLRAVSKSYRVDIFSFIVAEQHRSGTYHTHGMLVLDALLLEREVLRGIWSLAYSLYGINRFSLISRHDAVVRYVSKYITKRVTDFTFYHAVRC